jgi:hypothetical protein
MIMKKWAGGVVICCLLFLFLFLLCPQKNEEATPPQPTLNNKNNIKIPHQVDEEKQETIKKGGRERFASF